MDDQHALERILSAARQGVMIVEEQVAKFGISVPPHVLIDLEERRKTVASYEARLAQLVGQSPNTLPDNLPRRAGIFVGRTEEIARCLNALAPEERSWGVVIDGIGGIGKTSLALEVAHSARNRAMFDAYLFASAKTTWLSPAGVRQETLALSSLDAFIREFARLLGQEYILQITEPIERRRALLDALRGRRTLSIWDNLETLTNEERDLIAEFLRRLPAPNSAIVTSRYRSGESAITIRLDRLSEQEAIELMEGIGNRQPRVANELTQAGIGSRRALYEAAGGNPLALEWTLGLVAQKGYTLSEALNRLRDAARSSDLYAFLFADAVTSLAESDQAVLAALSTFHTPATADVLAEATDLVNTEIRVALDRLVTLSLVNDLETGRYGLHPLTRMYVHAALAGNQPTERAIEISITLNPNARRRALSYWLGYAQKYGGGRKNYQQFQHLDAQWPNLEAAATTLHDLAGVSDVLKDAEAASMLVDLARALNTFLRFRGYWDERIHLNKWAYEAAKAIGDWRQAGWRATDVVWVYYGRAEIDRALVWLDRATVALDRGGKQQDRVYPTRLRALLALQRHDLDEAERLYTEALASYRDLGVETYEANLLDGLGGVARERGQYEQADLYFRQALAIDEKMADIQGQAIRASHRADLALDCHNLARARKCFQRGLDLARSIGWQERVATNQFGLARVLEEEQRYNEALPLAEDVLRFREPIRHRSLEETRQLVVRLREKTSQSLVAPSNSP